MPPSVRCPRRTGRSATGNVSHVKPTDAGELASTLPAWLGRVSWVEIRSSINCYPGRPAVSRLCPSGAIFGRLRASPSFSPTLRRPKVLWCIAPLHQWPHHRCAVAWPRPFDHTQPGTRGQGSCVLQSEGPAGFGVCRPTTACSDRVTIKCTRPTASQSLASATMRRRAGAPSLMRTVGRRTRHHP